MAMPEPTFTPFPRLPTELRLAIWRCCLPNRVYELDMALDRIVYDLVDDTSSPSPCILYSTTLQNNCPPLMTRVCRESRSVAFETGSFITACAPDRPKDTQWISGNANIYRWIDAARDAPHLNWTPEYEGDYDCTGDPLRCLIWQATHSSGTASLMLHYLDEFANDPNYLASYTPGPSESPMTNSLSPAETRDIETYKKLSTWLVVMRIVVVHSDLDSVVATGLFGLSGDAPVQIVPAVQEARVKAFYDLAEGCERRQPATVGQNFHRESADSMRRHLNAVVETKFRSGQLATAMSPAIMFRLCTKFCNRCT